MSDTPTIQPLSPLMRDFRSSMSPEAIAALDASEKTEGELIRRFRERQRITTEEAQAAQRQAEALLTEQRIASTRSETELRDILRDAIVYYDAAADALHVADTLEQRAQERMDAIDAELADYADLDDQIAEFSVSQIREDKHDLLPADLDAAQLARGRLVDRIDAGHKAYAKLHAEAEAARQELQKASQRRSVAAAHIVRLRADEVAQELETIEEARYKLRVQLTSFGGLWLNFPNGSASLLGLTVRARDTLMKDRPEAQVDSGYSANVRDWFNRLMNDHEADLSEEE